ncbi:MAG TPA: hypothetical protein DCM87_01210 [Planctomycetes bacterium]|nr:hypothetical protein [Planctomycetota bacterium]
MSTVTAVIARVLAAALLAGALPAAAGEAPATDAVPERARRALAAGDHAAAIPELAAAIEHLERQGAGDGLLGELLYNLAVCYQKVGDGPRAAAAARRRLERVPGDRNMLELLGKISFVLGDYNAAAEAFDRLKALAPPTPRLLRQLVAVHTSRRSQEESAQAVRELLALDRSPASLEAALESHVAFHEHKEAIAVIEALTRAQGARPMYRFAAGYAHAKLDHREEAERELRAVLDDPLYGDDARFELGLVLKAERARHGEAVRVLAELLERDPYYAQAYFQLSQLLLRQGKREEGERLKEMHEALQQSERELRKGREFTAAGLSVEAAAYRSAGYAGRRQYRKAEAALRAEIEKQPDDPRLLVPLASLFLETERARDAEELLRGAAPNATLVRLLGLSLWRQGRLAEAEEQLRRVIDDPASGPTVRAALGRMYVEEHLDPEGALGILQPLLAENAPPPDAVLAAARARCERGEFEEAQRLCAALKDAEEPARSEARLYLAWCAIEQGAPPAALPLLDEVSGAHRGSGRYFSVKRKALEALGDAQASQYRAYEQTFTALEDEARQLRREVARARWPEAAANLIALVENAKRRRRPQTACHYASLAAEADPSSAEALRLLLECPMSDFVKLSALVRLARLAPADRATADQIAEIRGRYGIASAP